MHAWMCVPLLRQTESDVWIDTARLLLLELLEKCSADVLLEPKSEQLALATAATDSSLVTAPASDSQVVYHDAEKLAPPKPQVGAHARQ